MARSEDAARIDAFLEPYSESSMFLRSNLAHYGLGPDKSDDSRATTFWLVGDAKIRAVFGLSNAGFLMGQAPDNHPEDWRAFRDVLLGIRVAGITGAADQIGIALAELGLQDARFSVMREEPHYRLDLDELDCPSGAAQLRPARQDDYPVLVDWIIDYDTSVLGSPLTDVTRARAQANARLHIISANHRILEVDGAPVAKTAFNATLPDIVQIGGVYTPPAMRSKGYARLAVALHLREARDRGVKTAILFASGPAACRAYEAIGFRRIGTYTLAILATPHVMGSSA